MPIFKAYDIRGVVPDELTTEDGRRRLVRHGHLTPGHPQYEELNAALAGQRL